MKSVLLIFSFVLISCTAAERPNASKTPEKQQQAESPTPPPPPPPAAITQNLTLLGGVVKDIEFVDARQYRVRVEVRTAIPEGAAESLTEPGQTIILRPAYHIDDDGTLNMGNERNGRLYEVRSLKAGEAILGKISFGQDGFWYLHDTKL